MKEEIALKISNQIQNSTFSFQHVLEFVTLMEAEKKEFREFSYLGNGSSTLVLRALKNGREVALKVIQFQDHAAQIESMQRGYQILKQLPPSKYFMEVYGQFFVGEEQKDEDSSTGLKSDDVEFVRKVYFVEEHELCQGSLSDFLLQSQQGKIHLTDSLKEHLAIQILDVVNMLHQKEVTHGDIRAQNFLIATSNNDSYFLKLRKLGFNSVENHNNQIDQHSAIESISGVKLETQKSKNTFKQDLFFLGILFLQLDNPDTLDCKNISASQLVQLHEGNILEGHQLNRSSLLYKIACRLLSKKIENRNETLKILLLLLEKSKEYSKFPLLFSVVTKNWINSFSIEIPSTSMNSQGYQRGTNEGDKLSKLMGQFRGKEIQKKQLTTDLLRNALAIMFEWKEFKGEYEVLGVGSCGSVVFGVENLYEKRSSVLKLSLCSNKAETIREIGLMRSCQSPYIVRLFRCKFFEDANGNEFVVYELERCKYSLMHHLELQRIHGEYSDESKHLLMLQILNAVNHLHQHKILHRNLKLNAFLITENEHGQAVAKLTNFKQAATLQICFLEDTYFNQLLISKHYYPPFNCIIQNYNNESLLYYAPERWECPNPTTFYTDSYSVGLCLLLLDNYLVFTEKQLAERLIMSVSQPSEAILADESTTQLNTLTQIYRVAKQLLHVLPDQRKSLLDCISQLSECPDSPISQEGTLQQYGSKHIHDNNNNISLEFLQSLPTLISQQSNYLNLSIVSLSTSCIQIDPKSILSPIALLTNLSSLSLKMNTCQIGDVGAQILLNPLAGLINLINLSLNLWENSIGSSGAEFLLSPLSNLTNLSSLFLNLDNNPIGDDGAKLLLYPLKNLTNLTSLSLSCFLCEFHSIGAEYLLQPVSNLTNLQCIQLNLRTINIGDAGARSLLSPITNLTNMVSLSIDLFNNSIGDEGVEFLLSPLTNLINLTSLEIILDDNTIQDRGAQFLLSPLNNLLNLQSLNLSLWSNEIGDLGAQFLLAPITNLMNLSVLSINLNSNLIKDKGASFLLLPLSNLLKLSNISLEISGNQIEEFGASALLAPLSKLLKISSMSLNLDHNSIGCVGAESLLAPLADLVNLNSLSLSLRANSIGQNNEKSLLAPLVNLFNLTNLSLNLDRNQIGETGAQLLLSPLAGLLNLTSLSVNLTGNSIRDIGAQYLLSSLNNLQNLSSLSLSVNQNSITDAGAYSLISLLTGFVNLSDLYVHLGQNSIIKQSQQILKISLKKLKDFSFYE